MSRRRLTFVVEHYLLDVDGGVLVVGDVVQLVVVDGALAGLNMVRIAVYSCLNISIR